MYMHIYMQMYTHMHIQIGMCEMTGFFHAITFPLSIILAFKIKGLMYSDVF